MNIPKDLKYTKEHEWLRLNGSEAEIGITDYAQGELGDIVFVELPEKGAEIKASDAFGTIEAVKAVSELYAPIDGTVTEVNSAIEEDAGVINRDPYGDGWMIKITLADPSAADSLLGADQYKELIED